MPKFRKKPVVVEAQQWTPEPGRPTGTSDARGVEYLHNGTYAMQTLEGPFRVKPNDWIITGIKGEKYPCKPDIFEATYEPVKEHDHASAKTEP